MPQIYDMGPTALLPLRRKACWGFFRPLKIWRLQPGLNPRTRVLKASTLPLDHRSRLIVLYIHKYHLEVGHFDNLRIGSSQFTQCGMQIITWLKSDYFIWTKYATCIFSVLCRILLIIFSPKIWEIASFIINLEQINNTKVIVSADEKWG